MCAIDLVLSVISFQVGECFCSSFSAVLKYPQVAYMIYFNCRFSKEVEGKKIIAHWEALIIWESISSLFLYIDTSDCK